MTNEYRVHLLHHPLAQFFPSKEWSLSRVLAMRIACAMALGLRQTLSGVAQDLL
jgi:hypothetical protein